MCIGSDLTVVFDIKSGLFCVYSISYSDTKFIIIYLQSKLVVLPSLSVHGLTVPDSLVQTISVLNKQLIYNRRLNSPSKCENMRRGGVREADIRVMCRPQWLISADIMTCEMYICQA